MGARVSGDMCGGGVASLGGVLEKGYQIVLLERVRQCSTTCFCFEF
jgi:hypothetical protein